MELRFDTSSIDTTSWKLRSRHQMGGDCQNRFGGFGGSMSRSSVEVQIEECHNVHESGISKPLPKPVATGQWIGVRFSVYNTADNNSVFQQVEIDYKDGAGFKPYVTATKTNPPAYYMDKETFDEESEFWLRINNESSTGSVSFRNVTLTEVAPGGGTSGGGGGGGGGTTPQP
jgi:hypothetical protein